MAELLRGKRKGEPVRLHQWANDWFSVEHADGSPGIITPSSLLLTPEEYQQWQGAPSGMDRLFSVTNEPGGYRFTRNRR